MKRKAPTLSNKLASALLALGYVDHEHAKLMTDAQVISLFHFDHYPIPHAHDGPTIGWNLVPRLIKAHREKTAKTDVPMIAKTRRVESDWKQFTARMSAKTTGEDVPAKRKSRLQSRGFDKGKRKFGEKR